MNIFLAKRGVSPYFSPHILLGGRNYNYKKDCQVSYGSYVQAEQDPKHHNSNKPRTVDGIYLCLLNNQQRGHEVIHLHMGKVIYPRSVTGVLVINSVIKIVEEMAERQGIKV